MCAVLRKLSFSIYITLKSSARKKLSFRSDHQNVRNRNCFITAIKLRGISVSQKSVRDFFKTSGFLQTFGGLVLGTKIHQTKLFKKLIISVKGTYKIISLYFHIVSHRTRRGTHHVNIKKNF